MIPTIFRLPLTRILRLRVMVAALLVLLPTLGLITYSAHEERQAGIAQAEADALRIARDAIARHRYMGDLTADLGWLRSALDTAELPENSLISLVDRNGTIIARYPDVAGEVGKDVPDAEDFRRLVAQGGEGVNVGQAADAVDRIFANVPLEHALNATTYLRVGIPREVATTTANRSLARNLTATVAAILLVFEMAWLYSTLHVRRRTRALVEATLRPGGGDVTALARLASPPREFGALAESFDHMAQGLQRVTRAWRTLSAGNHALLRAEDEAALLAEMCRVGADSGGYRLVWVAYAEDDAEKSVRPVASAGRDGGFLDAIRISWGDGPQGQGTVGAAIRTGRPQVVRDLDSDPRFAPWREAALARGYASGCGLPLVIDGRTIGAIAFYAGDADAFDDKEIELLGELAENLAFGIRTLRRQAEHRQAEATIRQMAYYDQLTGLARRMLLTERLRQTVAGEIPGGDHCALFLIEIERFREIRGALGCQWGDRLLQEIARRLRGMAPPDWLCARLLGDRFGVLLPAADAATATAAAQRVQGIFAAPFELAGILVDVQASIGIALFPDHGHDPDLLIQRASLAAGEGLKGGGEITLYRHALAEENPRRLALVAQLRQAIEDDQLVLHYQPKVDTVTGRVTGAEALVRWEHPAQGLIPPGEFITLAEQTGLIKPLTYWVLNAALHQAAAWNAAGLDLPVAVNLSARNLRDPRLMDEIERCLAASGASPGQLQIEITESVLMEDHVAAHAILSRLKGMGIRLYIDDFGTGYSSLGYLATLPVHALKVDRSFVVGLGEKPEMATVVAAIVTMGHNLGLTIVAEGVERQDQFDALCWLGCDEIQGYLFSRPLPAAAFQEWYRNFPATLPA